MSTLWHNIPMRHVNQIKSIPCLLDISAVFSETKIDHLTGFFEGLGYDIRHILWTYFSPSFKVQDWFIFVKKSLIAPQQYML